MGSPDDYPALVPATVAQLRELLAEHGRARCDDLLPELFPGPPILIGQLVAVAGETYRVGGIAGTPIRWLDHRPYNPATADAYPYREPDTA